MEKQWEAQEALGVARSGEIDGIRQLLIDTDPKLIALTVVVSLLHTLFNFLAFSNDVKFYRKIKDFSGLSLRSMVSIYEDIYGFVFGNIRIFATFYFYFLVFCL
jgi:hypothetical protein